jgi:hypothetical protein
MTVGGFGAGAIELRFDPNVCARLIRRGAAALVVFGFGVMLGTISWSVIFERINCWVICFLKVCQLQMLY